jgi:hypothetical protein
MGVYFLASAPFNEAGAIVFGATDGSGVGSSYGMIQTFGANLVFEWNESTAPSALFEANVQIALGDGTTINVSNGVLICVRNASGGGAIYRNGQPLLLNNLYIDNAYFPTPGVRLDGSSPLSAGTIRADSTVSAMGGLFIAKGDFDAGKAATMTLIMQTLNKNLGTPRAVFPDGLN